MRKRIEIKLLFAMIMAAISVGCATTTDRKFHKHRIPAQSGNGTNTKDSKYDDDYPVPTPYIVAIDGNEIAKLSQSGNISQLCHLTTLNQARADSAWDPPFASDAELISTLSNLSVRPGNAFLAWQASYFPDFEVRKLGFFKTIVPNMGFDTPEQYLEYLRGNFSTMKKGFFIGNYSTSTETTYSSQISNLSTILNYQAACNYLVIGTGCGFALRDAVEMAKPSRLGTEEAGYFLALAPLYKEILADRKYDAGLLVATEKMFQMLQSTEIGDSDLFSDLMSSFLASGKAKSESIEMTFNVLGLISTGGAIMLSRFLKMPLPPDQLPMVVALSSIAGISPALDSLAIQKGRRFYSYPKTIKTTCDSGKPYHFYLTAYLARKLKQKGYSSRAAAAAAYTAQKGYQLFSETNGRQPWRPFTEHYLGSYSTSIRMDLAYASAAAIFGAFAEDPQNREKVINIDQGLERILRESRALSSGTLTKNDALELTHNHPVKYFLKWQSLFAPDAAFQFYFRKK